jgi:hypothetical protein
MRHVKLQQVTKNRFMYYVSNVQNSKTESHKTFQTVASSVRPHAKLVMVPVAVYLLRLKVHSSKTESSKTFHLVASNMRSHAIILFELHFVHTKLLQDIDICINILVYVKRNSTSQAIIKDKSQMDTISPLPIVFKYMRDRCLANN